MRKLVLTYIIGCFILFNANAQTPFTIEKVVEVDSKSAKDLFLATKYKLAELINTYNPEVEIEYEKIMHRVSIPWTSSGVMGKGIISLDLDLSFKDNRFKYLIKNINHKALQSYNCPPCSMGLLLDQNEPPSNFGKTKKAAEKTWFEYKEFILKFSESLESLIISSTIKQSEEW